MDLNQHFRDAILRTQVVQAPKNRISTFGDTKIQYFFLSEIDTYKDRSRLRRGVVVAERPKIITIEAMKERFEGFDKNAQEFGDWLTRQYGDSFRALQYQFKNEEYSSNVEHTPVPELADQIKKRMTEAERRQSLIAMGPGTTWQISLMKFIIDECGASFSTNVRDLEEHGFFDTPEQMKEKRKQMIEDLFRKCREERSYIPVLGRKLQEFGLFEEYQDDFFKFVK